MSITDRPLTRFERELYDALRVGMRALIARITVGHSFPNANSTSTQTIAITASHRTVFHYQPARWVTHLARSDSEYARHPMPVSAFTDEHGTPWIVCALDGPAHGGESAMLVTHAEAIRVVPAAGYMPAQYTPQLPRSVPRPYPSERTPIRPA